MSDVIPIKDKIQAVDENLREFWDMLDETQQKGLKQDFFILNRYISSVGNSKWGSKKPTPREVQEHFVLSVNELFNKNWNSLQKHPKLLWLLLCMCSYDGHTVFYHEWIGYKKKTDKSSNKKIKFLSEIYPNMKNNEIEMLAKISTDNEVKELAKQYGLDDSTIQKKLK